jgi:hypothetical protein
MPPETVALLRRLLAAGVPQSEAAVEAGVSVGVLRSRLKDQLADLPPRRRGPPPGHRGGDWNITPDEIRRRCAAIRETWPVERFLPAAIHDLDRMGRIVEGRHDARSWAS